MVNESNGQWGLICDNSFGITDAHVVCKMLGYPTAILALANSANDELYGSVPSGSDFVLDNSTRTLMPPLNRHAPGGVPQ